MCLSKAIAKSPAGDTDGCTGRRRLEDNRTRPADGIAECNPIRCEVHGVCSAGKGTAGRNRPSAGVQGYRGGYRSRTAQRNTVIIRGIQGIKSVSYRKDTNYYELKDGKYEQITQYILDTDGSNFLEIMNHPYVNGNGVLSSHVHDIYENLGIEAARAILLSEITNLFADAGGVDFRHLGLLCDWMTRIGKLMSVDRYGINKNDIGTLAKASFEETEKILLKAALFGEVDPVIGVSANIMTGQPIRGGTTFSEILFDEQVFMRLQEGLAPVADEEEEEYEPDEDEIESELYESQDDNCAIANLKLNVTLGTQLTSIVEEPDIEATFVDE
jgi:hypothetical protein